MFFFMVSSSIWVISRVDSEETVQAADHGKGISPSNLFSFMAFAKDHQRCDITGLEISSAGIYSARNKSIERAS